MAPLLVELKLRLVGNALRSSTPAQMSFIISTVFAALARSEPSAAGRIRFLTAF